MTTEYMEKESSKKKYLAPLVVIMLCLVAITGAAYAYSTTVTGNGDIKGNYVVLDMYDDNGAEAATRYTATANLDVVAGAFTVTTDKTVTTDDSGADKSQYVANVVTGALEYYTILHINTNDTTANTFYLTDPEYQYTAPTATESVTPGTLTLGDLTVKSVTDSTGATISRQATTGSTGYYILNSTEYYKITFTIAITAGEFGTYDSLNDLKDSLDLFDAKANELAVKFTASDAAPTD